MNFARRFPNLISWALLLIAVAAIVTPAAFAQRFPPIATVANYVNAGGTTLGFGSIPASTVLYRNTSGQIVGNSSGVQTDSTGAYLGIGTAPSWRLHAKGNASGLHPDNTFYMETAHTAGVALTGVYASSGGAEVETIAYGGTATGTFLGTNKAGASAMLGAPSANGYLIGTLNNFPVIIGTNDAARLTIAAGGTTATFAPVVLGPNGSASAPTYSGTNDTNTGAYFDAADRYIVATGGQDNTSFGPASIASGASATNRHVYTPAQTITVTGGTGITTATGFNQVEVGQPTYSCGSALTITNAATHYIAAAPTGTGAGPCTITNAYSLWIDDGAARFDHRILGASAGVTAANNLTLGSANLNLVSGNTTINCLDTVGWTAGSTATLLFSGTPIVTDSSGGCGTTFKLIDIGAAFTASANDVMTVVYDGTNWKEVSRSVN